MNLAELRQAVLVEINRLQKCELVPPFMIDHYLNQTGDDFARRTRIIRREKALAVIGGHPDLRLPERTIEVLDVRIDGEPLAHTTPTELDALEPLDWRTRKAEPTHWFIEGDENLTLYPYLESLPLTDPSYSGDYIWPLADGTYQFGNAAHLEPNGRVSWRITATHGNTYALFFGTLRSVRGPASLTLNLGNDPGHAAPALLAPGLYKAQCSKTDGELWFQAADWEGFVGQPTLLDYRELTLSTVEGFTARTSGGVEQGKLLNDSDVPAFNPRFHLALVWGAVFALTGDKTAFARYEEGVGAAIALAEVEWTHRETYVPYRHL